jgi:hypothetical protein
MAAMMASAVVLQIRTASVFCLLRPLSPGTSARPRGLISFGFRKYALGTPLLQVLYQQAVLRREAFNFPRRKKHNCLGNFLSGLHAATTVDASMSCIVSFVVQVPQEDKCDMSHLRLSGLLYSNNELLQSPCLAAVAPAAL